MKKSFLVRCFPIIFAFCTTISAQIQWEKFYGGDKYEFASKLIELSDKNLLVCSYTQSFGAGDADFWIIKLTPSGDTIWTKTYGGSAYECATAAHELSDGSILVAGNTASFVEDTSNCAWDLWLLKLNPMGDTIWSKTFFGNRSAGVDMVVDGQENIFLAANSNKNDPLQDVQVIKCKANGTTEWVKYFGGSDRETLEAFCRTSDGSLLLLMTSQSFSPKTMWLFKITENGDKVWDRTYGGTFRYGNASDIIELPDGTYMMAGYNGETTQTTMFILKMNPDGTIKWQKNYSEFTSNWAPTFNLLSSGNFFISTIVSPAAGGDQVRLIRMNDTGEVLWKDLLGDTGAYTVANSFLETSDGKFLMLGGTNRLTKAADDLWLVSLAPDMYVNMGGEFVYHLVANADSGSYTYKILSAPPQMTVSTGGTLQWKPQTSTVFSELVSVAMQSTAKTDTVGFIVHVNKDGTAIIQTAVMSKAQSVGKSADIQMTHGYALISAPVNEFKDNIYSMRGSKITSVSSGNGTSVVWNFTDMHGTAVPSGRYIVQIISRGCIANAVATVMR